MARDRPPDTLGVPAGKPVGSGAPGVGRHTALQQGGLGSRLGRLGPAAVVRGLRADRGGRRQHRRERTAPWRASGTRGCDWWRRPNAGPGAARNRGLGEAAGEYVAFLDADDEWEPRFLGRAVAALDGHPECGAWVSGRAVGPRARQPGPAEPAHGAHGRNLAAPSHAPPKSLKFYVDFCHSSCVVARRSLVRRYGGYYDVERSSYGEDSYLWLMFVMNHRLQVDPEPWVWFHTEHSGLGSALLGRHPVRPALTRRRRAARTVRPRLPRASCTTCWRTTG